MSPGKRRSARATAKGDQRVACDATVCTFCGRGPDLSTGALIRLPGWRRWCHRACYDAHPELATAEERRVAETLARSKRRRLPAAARAAVR